MAAEHRSIEDIIDEQARRWRSLRYEPHTGAPRPVVAISRQHGAGGGELGRRLAQELGFGLFDRELIHRIAESAQLSERIVEALDEREREQLSEWLLSLASDRYLSPAGYHLHLTRVVGAIARLGGAVILGRGAHLILGPGHALRVLVVAPLEARIATIMQREGLGEREARRRIEAVERERAAFLRTHFHADPADVSAFDLVVNTAAVGVEGATLAVRGALSRLPARPSTPGPSLAGAAGR